jgi:hypothetical protein
MAAILLCGGVLAMTVGVGAQTSHNDTALKD